MTITNVDKLRRTLDKLRGKSPTDTMTMADALLSLQCLKKYSPLWEKIVHAPGKQEVIVDAIQGMSDEPLKNAIAATRFNALSNDELHDLVDCCAMPADIQRNDWQQMMERLDGMMEHVTPATINTLLVKLLAPQSEVSVIDCTCGTGSTLAACLDEVPSGLKLYGEDINTNAISTAIRLSRLYDQPATFLNTDTLGNDVFLNNKDGSLKHFDAAVSVHPFGIAYKEKCITEDKFKRFRQDALPRKSSSEWLFIQNTLARLNDKGKAVLLITPSVLFVGGSELELRKGLLENDIVDAVISLPAGLFQHTAIKTVCLILNKNKASARQYKVQFIDADSNVEPLTYGRNRKALSSDSIAEIVDIYHQNKEVEGYSAFISFNDIRKNRFDLDVSRYVQKPIDVQLRPLEDIADDIVQAHKDYEQARATFESALNNVTKKLAGS